MEPGERLVIYSLQFFLSFQNFDSVLGLGIGNMPKSKIQIFNFGDFGEISEICIIESCISVFESWISAKQIRNLTGSEKITMNR